MNKWFLLTSAVFFWVMASLSNAAEIRMAVTTSFNNSGLSEILLPEIERDLDLEVRLLVVGTGQALKLGRAGDVDAILVHSKSDEELFIEQGYGTHRREIMYNDFVLIGPETDPAKLASHTKASDAFQAIQQTKSAFLSRGDESGTHKKELTLWQSINLDPNNFDPDWYRASGSGMGASLNTASGMNAYIMSDRASWLKFQNKGNLKLLFSGDPTLFNQYAFIPVNPDRHSHVKFDDAKRLEQWLTSMKAQSLIGAYKINGETLFVPNAKPE